AALDDTGGGTLDDADGLEISPYLHEQTQHALEEAYETAVRFKNDEISPLHLFIGALTTDDASRLFARLDISFEQVKEPLLRRLTAQPTAGTPRMGESAQEVVLQSVAFSLSHGRKKITPIELIMAAYDNDPFLQDLLFSKKIERQDFENVVAWVRVSDEFARRARAFSKAASRKPKGAMNRAYTSVITPFLDALSEDLTRAAAYGRFPILVNREQEMKAILRAIEGGYQSVVLVGETGVGKEALITGLADRMVEERVPAILQDKRLVRLSLPHLVSGTSGTESEMRLLQALREIGMSGNIITVVKDIDQMIGTGLDLSAVLASELDKHYTFVIATTTPEAYVTRVERSVLGQKLIKIPITEPSVNEAILVLESKIPAIEYQQRVLFTYQAVSACVHFSARYLHERFLPEKAIELAQEVALAVRQGKGERARVTAEDVAEIVSEKSHVPVTEVSSDEKETLLNMENRLHERVIGQDEAINAISSALRRARTALRSEDRPIATFLFLGPTGVGKTELAKTVSEVYFGSEDAMVRFDMSEFQGAEAIERLIGGPGHGGLLTEAVRQKPFALLLLDEFEKAHPEVLNLFLQVMDDGRLSDGAGRRIDFTNVILIATSNAGSAYIQEAVRAGTPIEEIKARLINEELKTMYRPELLNRFDGTIVLKPLGIDEVIQIAYLLLAKVAERLQAKGIALRMEDAAVEEIAKKGFDPQFGARPLRRVIQESVDNAIANLILKGEVGRRDTLVIKAGGVVEIEKAPEL
ncbi:MAG: ATP-dependent Clp protease ATP-binding subunit, partial [Patescibacteria group bacterium]